MRGSRSFGYQKGQIGDDRRPQPPIGGEGGEDDCTDGEPMELAQADYLDRRMPTLASAVGALPVSQPAHGQAEVLGEHFAGVVERYQGPLISFLFGMVANREQAEDLAQETLIKAYEGMKQRREGQVFTSGWLFRIARNAAIDALRRRRLIAWLPFGAEHEAAMPDHSDFAGQLADRDLVQQVLARMPARYREALMLRSVADLSNGEVAVAMGISIRNANTTLFRARERFREIYMALEGEPTSAAYSLPENRETETHRR